MMHRIMSLARLVALGLLIGLASAGKHTVTDALTARVGLSTSLSLSLSLGGPTFPAAPPPGACLVLTGGPPSPGFNTTADFLHRHGELNRLLNGAWTNINGGNITPATLNGQSLTYLYCVQYNIDVFVPGTYNNTAVNRAGIIDGRATRSSTRRRCRTSSPTTLPRSSSERRLRRVSRRQLVRAAGRSPGGGIWSVLTRAVVIGGFDVQSRHFRDIGERRCGLLLRDPYGLGNYQHHDLGRAVNTAAVSTSSISLVAARKS